MMKTTWLVLVVILTLAGQLPAQWSKMNLGFSDDLYSVDFYNTDIAWIGSYNAVLQTVDGGNSWNVTGPIKDELNVPVFPANINDLVLINPNSAIATGFLYAGNEEYVLKTTNSGQNWHKVATLQGGNLPKYTEAVAIWDDRVVVAANSSAFGHFWVSNDAGNTWTFVSAGPIGVVEDVVFATKDTLFAVGNGSVLRSDNGGLNWTYHAVPASLETVCYRNGVFYAGVSYQPALLKSTDAGETFERITLPFESNGVIYAVDQNTVLAAGTSGLFISRSGGQYWEKFDLPGYSPINMIDFFNAEQGMAVGNGGYAIRTGNLSATPSLPLSFFEIVGDDLDFCFGDTLHLINRSAPGYTYQWLKNGVLVSTDYQPALPLQEAGNFTITLVVSNTFGSSTHSIDIRVDGHLDIPPMQVTLSADTVCSGTKVVLTFPYSFSGGYYALRKDGQDVGQLEYLPSLARVTTPEISGNTLFQLIAFRYNTCFTDSLVQEINIYDATPPADAPYFLSRDSVCYYDSVSLLIPNSLPGYRYSWHSYSQNANGAGFVDGTGGSIAVPLPLLDTSGIFAPRVVSAKYGCSTVLLPGKTVHAERPYPYFTLSTFNPEQGEAVYTVNNSLNPLGTYTWDFGAGATPQITAANSPTNIVFQSAGQQSVQLLAVSPYGCKDSVQRKINVLEAFAAGDCRFAQGAGVLKDDGPLSIAQDDHGNMLYWYSGGRNYKYLVYGNHGDSTINLWNDDLHFSYGNFLTKFNPKGVPQWTVQLRHESTQAGYGEVTTDGAGNIYCTYFHGDYLDDVLIFSSDGRVTRYDPPKSGIAGVLPVLVLKFDKDGVFQWVNAYMESYALGRLSVKSDEAGNVYVCSDNSLRKYNSSGAQEWAHEGGGYYTDVDIDSQGFIWASIYNGSTVLKKYKPANGDLAFETAPIPDYAIDYIKIDNLDNIYLAGIMQGSMVFGNDTLPDYGVALCKMKPNGLQEWAKPLQGSQNIIKDIAIKNNHILLLVTAFSNVQTPNLPLLPFTGGGHYLYHTDSLGGAEAIEKLYDSPQLVIYSDQGSLIGYGKNSDRLALAFEFEEDFVFDGKVVKAYDDPDFGERNFFIASGNLNCFIQDIPQTPTPYSYFIPSTMLTCAGESVTFQDLSSNQPVSWQWTFPGGIPASSTDQNPVVYFSTPGTFTATLMATNAAGKGTVFSKKIVVRPTPVIAATGNLVACENQSEAGVYIETDTPPLGYQWQDSSATHGWADIPGAVEYSLSILPEMANNGRKYRCLVRYDCATYVSNALEVTVAPLPEVSCPPVLAVCHSIPGLTLNFGQPAGGTYSGYGMVNDSVFAPMGVIPNVFPLMYSYADLNGCSNSAIMNLMVEYCPPLLCDNPGLVFSGTNEYVERAMLNNFPVNSDFTIEAWMMIDYGTIWDGCPDANFRRLFSLAGPNSAFEIGQCGGSLAIYWKDATVHGPFTTSNVYLFEKTLWHIAVTRKGSLLQVYLDGERVYLSNVVGALDLNTFRLGFPAAGGVDAKGWIGIMDDVRFWKSARTTAQIAQDRKACPPTGNEPDLVLYWNMDDGIPGGNNTAITQVADRSPNGNQGTLTNFSLTDYWGNFSCSDAPLLYGSFYHTNTAGCGIPGLLTDQMVLNTPPAQNLSYFWDFGDGTSSADPIPLHQFDACSSNTVCLTITGEGCSVKHCQTVEDAPPKVYCPEDRFVVAYEPECVTPVSGLTWLQATDNCYEPVLEFTTYGAAVLSGTGDASGVVLPAGESIVQYLATDSCGNTGTCTFRVTVDCLDCFYNVDVGLTGYFPFDGDALDLSATGIPGTAFDVESVNGHNGMPNGALHFNGISSGVNCSGHNRGVTDEVTLCAWVKTGTGQAQWIAGKYSAVEGLGFHLLSGDSSGQFAGRAVFAGSDGTGMYHSSGFSGTAINDGNWHCLVGIAAEGLWQIYVDGRLESSGVGSTSLLAPSTAQPLTIGWNNDPALPLYMEGDIDETRLYNRKLNICDIDSVCGTVKMVQTTAGKPDLRPLHLYPNPNTGLLNIDFPSQAPANTTIRITDPAGRLMLEQPVEPGVLQQKLDVHQLPAGLYFLHSFTAKQVSGRGKFIRL